MLKKIRQLLWIGVLAGLVFLGWRVFSAARPVQVISPQKKEIVELVVASGKLRAVQQSSLGSEVSTIVDKLLVKEGDRVEAGQILIRLRTAEIEAQIEQSRRKVEITHNELAKLKLGTVAEELQLARLQVKLAQTLKKQAVREWERTQQLSSKNTLSYAEIEKAQTVWEKALVDEEIAQANLELLLKQPRPEDLKIAESRLTYEQAALKVAEEQLTRRIIRAPFAGLIVQRHVEAGQSVAVGSTLLSLANLESIEIYVETDENNLARLRVGQPATVIAPSYPERPFAARLMQIGPFLDHERGVVEIRLRPTRLPDFFLLNMTVDVNIEVARLPESWSIPAGSVIQDKKLSYVLVVTDRQVTRREVKILGKSLDWVAVTGVEPADKIVVRASEVQVGQTVSPK